VTQTKSSRDSNPAAKGAPDGAPDRAAVLAALERVVDPRSGKGLVSAGLVQALVVAPGRAGFMFEVPAADAKRLIPVRDAAEAALLAVPGVQRAQVVMTAEGASGVPHAPHAPHAPASHAEPPLVDGAVRVRKTANLPPEAQSKPGPHGYNPNSPMNPQPVPHVRHVIAVASGKGGVGKSTVAVNLAVALAKLGLRVGLLDADVYGPSAPRMLGLTDEPVVGPDKKLIPLEAWGIKAISIGFIVDEGSPMIWRGPMASSAMSQLFNDVNWGSDADPLDVLVLDLPPGTGDIQLTLVQKFKLLGAVIVSTPQEVALIDVRRGAAMFQKTGVPILGVVENMAYFSDPTTGAPIEIFGRGGAAQTARDLDVPFLGEIPIDVALRQACDSGTPIAASGGDSVAGRAFATIAETLARGLG
jgi:ATP-binding protein involved in chromosome partitioning